mmetsp:Transcript_25628/g.54484  ORF Transcript_25628/g.54484 Transcript_25628/m.54484 type:complete len:330 (-) Transcript_25628:22-1011(-)
MNSTFDCGFIGKLDSHLPRVRWGYDGIIRFGSFLRKEYLLKNCALTSQQKAGRSDHDIIFPSNLDVAKITPPRNLQQFGAEGSFLGARGVRVAGRQVRGAELHVPHGILPATAAVAILPLFHLGMLGIDQPLQRNLDARLAVPLLPRRAPDRFQLLRLPVAAAKSAEGRLHPRSHLVKRRGLLRRLCRRHVAAPLAIFVIIRRIAPRARHQIIAAAAAAVAGRQRAPGGAPLRAGEDDVRRRRGDGRLVLYVAELHRQQRGPRSSRLLRIPFFVPAVAGGVHGSLRSLPVLGLLPAPFNVIARPDRCQVSFSIRSIADRRRRRLLVAAS